MIDYIFVMFKHSATLRKAVEVFEREPAASKLIRILCCVRSPRQQAKQFRGKELDVEQAVEPDEIVWEHLGVAQGSTSARKFLTYLVSLLVIMAAAILTAVVEGQRRSAESDYPAIKCPSETVRKEQAYLDVKGKLVPGGMNTGLMDCYCQ